MAAGVTVYTVQTTNTQLLSTELNNLANGSYAVSSAGGSSGAFNNSPQTIGSLGPTANLGGYLRAKLQALLTQFATAPSAGGNLQLWFIHSLDGTNFEDSSSPTNPRNPDVTIPVETQNTAGQRITMDIKLPPGAWKVMLLNNTGQAMPASGNVISIEPYTAGE